MLSVWPELFTYQLVAVSLLRITASYLFLLMGIRLITTVRHASIATRRRFFMYGYALLQTTIGALLCVGVFTQVVALFGALLVLISSKSHTRGTGCEQHLNLLLFVICISILFLGPGLFAVDVPL